MDILNLDNLMSSNYIYEPFEKAAELGVDVVLPNDHELQIDIDTPEQKQQFYQILNLLNANGIKIDIIKETVSPGGNTHIYCGMVDQKCGQLCRIAFQAVLGSDPKREALSLVRHIQGYPHPTLFFETKR